MGSLLDKAFGHYRHMFSLNSLEPWRYWSFENVDVCAFFNRTERSEQNFFGINDVRKLGLIKFALTILFTPSGPQISDILFSKASKLSVIPVTRNNQLH